MTSGCFDHSAIWSRTKIWRRKRSSLVCASAIRSGSGLLDIAEIQLCLLFRARPLHRVHRTIERSLASRLRLPVRLFRLEQLQPLAHFFLLGFRRHFQRRFLPLYCLVEIAVLGVGGGESVDYAVCLVLPEFAGLLGVLDGFLAVAEL